MGKTKRRRNKNKPCPTGEVESGLEKIEDVGNDEHMSTSGYVRGLNGVISRSSVKSQTEDIVNTLKSLFKQFQSDDSEAKEWAFCTLSSLIDKPEAIEHIIRLNSVKIIAPLLTDQLLTVRRSAVEFLRKLSAVDHDICEAMITQDVMTSLVSLFRTQFSPGWQPKQSSDGKINTAVFIEATYLLLNLCESNSRAVKTFNKENLLEFLIPCLNLAVYGDEVTVAVAYCLQTVTEDNLQTAALLNEKANEEIVDRLFNLEGQNANAVLLRILATGIIVNRNFGRLSSCSSTFIVNMMQLLANTLAINSDVLIKAVAAKAEFEQGGTVSNSLEWVLSAQQIALEILINIFFVDDDCDNWGDVESSDASDEMLFVDDAMDHDQLTSSQSLHNIPTEITDAIISQNFTSLILSKLSTQSEDSLQKLKKSPEGRKLIDQVNKIRSRSLLCLNNLAGCIDTRELGGQTNLFSAWVDIGKLLFKTSDVELLEAASKAMGAIVEKLAESKSRQFESFSAEDLNKFFDLFGTVEEAQVKANIIRIANKIGCLMVQSQEICSAQLKLTGLFLLDVCQREIFVWVACEALDAILDIFGEDNMNQLMQEMGMMEKLKSFLPQLKHKITTQRRDLDNHLPVVMTAKTNLIRFIKYKALTCK